MSFRTVVIKNRSKLDLKLNHLVCRNENEFRVFIPEISVLILESTAISITTALISELVKNNVKIIVCDEKHNPESEILPYYGHYNSSKKILEQLSWDDDIKSKVWTKIVANKILQQSFLLAKNNYTNESNMIKNYISEIKENDITNREGFAAKVYFNALFGMEFTRRSSSDINSALNYGYSIVLSCFNREIAKNGYLTQLGLFHKNEFNFYNLASDLMEPFRIIVDKIVLGIGDNFENFKEKVLKIFDVELKIGGKTQMFENAISIYCSSIFDALNNRNEKLIKFYDM